MKATLFSCLLVLFVCNGCSQLKTISDTLAGLKRLEFKLHDVKFFKLNGVELENKSSISDISLMDGIALASAYSSKQLPVTFILNLDVKNPNDGTAGSKNTTATLRGLDFRLLIDDKQTINGELGSSFTIPASGSSTIVPIAISLDLMNFFADKGYQDLANLALAIGGKQGSAGRLTLDVKPTVDTPLGAITYPSRIKIVDKEFRN